MVRVQAIGNEADRLEGYDLRVADLRGEDLLPTIVAEAVLDSLGGIDVVVNAAEHLGLSHRAPDIARLIDEALISVGYEEHRRRIFPELQAMDDSHVVQLELGDRIVPTVLSRFASATAALVELSSARAIDQFNMDAFLGLSLCARLESEVASKGLGWVLEQTEVDPAVRSAVVSFGSNLTVPEPEEALDLLRAWGALL